MKSFEHLILCSCDNPGHYNYILADLVSGCLEISGCEWGEKLKNYADIEEWGFHMEFNEAETDKLFSLIGGSQNPADALKKAFGGAQCEQMLKDFCSKNAIEYYCWHSNS